VGKILDARGRRGSEVEVEVDVTLARDASFIAASRGLWIERAMNAHMAWAVFWNI
jgi:hypothetical protein